MELSKCGSSAFVVTFTLEILGIEVFHDCNEGWLDLGSGPVQGLKIQYQLAPGQSFDLDVLIWPHAAKIWCGMNSGWVRTWQFLQRRWLAFSINHIFPVRVMDFRDYVATVSPHVGLGSISANAKNDKNTEVYLPKLSFGERRQFASVLEPEKEISLMEYLQNIIWNLIVDYIPPSYLDGPFGVPHPVNDKRHRDAVLEHVQGKILELPLFNESEISTTAEDLSKVKDLKGKDPKEKDLKEKKKTNEVVKFEIKLSGDAIISGTGRIVPFTIVGEKPQDLGEIIVLIGSASLPAYDDNPVVFINIGKLMDAPIEEFQKRNITHIYGKWILSNEEHKTDLKEVSKKEIDFNDNHSVPLPRDIAAEVIASFTDNDYEIELHGVRPETSAMEQPSFFGYAKEDRNFAKAFSPKQSNQNNDLIIATTKINTRNLKSVNSFIRGDYSLYPPRVFIKPLERERICTNDINAIRMPLHPDLNVPAGIILQAQMTIEVSIGVVGCKFHKMSKKYSRLYCLIKDTEEAMTILRNITEINENEVANGMRENLLTGFALDIGDTVILYVEGPRDGQILHVWEQTENYYPEMKPVFSTTAKYHCRLYPELLLTAMPFNIMKMFVPLNVLLACPPIYARPALPLPTRFAVLKIGRLLASKLLNTPNACELPTGAELQSFRLELCVAPRPPPVVMANEENVTVSNNEPMKTITQKINWESNDLKKDKIKKKLGD